MGHRTTRSLVLALLVGAVFAGAGRLPGIASLPGLRPGPGVAAADVDHAIGFRATVDGYRSWFGAYGMGALGRAWCIDHGIAAPDPDLAYVPTAVDDHAPETRRAMAWALFRNGGDPDATGAAALMLVLHDLMGARYPSGPINVDTLPPGRLSGFSGSEHEVIDRARAIKADAVAHAAYVAPFSIAASVEPVRVGAEGVLDAHVTDVNGVPVPDIKVHVAATGPELTDRVEAVTAEDGLIHLPFVAYEGENQFSITADVPGALSAFAPTRRPAQRVARPAVDLASAETAFTALPVPGAIDVHKIDAVTGAPLPGAVFELRADTAATAAGQGIEGAPIGTTHFGDLAPGRYAVIETTAPQHYRAGTDQIPVDVAPGATATVTVPNQPLATVAFVKTPPVEGARFAVATTDGAPVAACTTDAAGRCQLEADTLDGAREYSWTEEAAPEGWKPAAPGRFTTGGAGSAVEVTVVEEREAAAIDTPPPTTTPTTTITPAPTSTTTTTTMPTTSPSPDTPPVDTQVEAAAPIVRSVAPPAVETFLPATGQPVRRWAGEGLACIAIGAALLAAVVSPATSSAGRTGRRRQRRRRSSAAA